MLYDDIKNFVNNLRFYAYIIDRGITMSRIKSAWEIAMEKTEGMEIDQEKIRHNSTIDKIRRIAGTYITDNEESKESLKNKLKEFSPSFLKEALSQTVLNSLVLPQDDTGLDEKREKIAAIITIAFPDGEITGLYNEIATHLMQYPKHKEELVKKLKEQIEPMLRQKEESMREKYGQSVHLTIENDKEAMEMVKSYIDRLNQQYQEVLDEGKAEMKKKLEEEQ